MLKARVLWAKSMATALKARANYATISFMYKVIIYNAKGKAIIGEDKDINTNVDTKDEEVLGKDNDDNIEGSSKIQNNQLITLPFMY